jgi:hypothetical protein
VLTLGVLAETGRISDCNVMRTPASILGLGGGLPAAGPTSYGLFQMLLGLVQIAIRILMLAGY